MKKIVKELCFFLTSDMTFDLMIGSVLLVHCEIIIIKSLRNDWIHQHGLRNYESIDHRTSTLRLKLAMPVSIRR